MKDSVVTSKGSKMEAPLDKNSLKSEEEGTLSCTPCAERHQTGSKENEEVYFVTGV